MTNFADFETAANFNTAQLLAQNKLRGHLLGTFLHGPKNMFLKGHLQFALSEKLRGFENRMRFEIAGSQNRHWHRKSAPALFALMLWILVLKPELKFIFSSCSSQMLVG